MESSFDPGALLARSFVLPRGPRVCLRLIRPGDQSEIAALLARCGAALERLELARLVRLDPRRRQAICATALVDMHELIVGVGLDRTRAPGSQRSRHLDRRRRADRRSARPAHLRPRREGRSNRPLARGCNQPRGRVATARACATARIRDLIVSEQSKPRTEAFSMEILPTIDALRWTARSAQQILADEEIPTPRLFLKSKSSSFTYEPLGVIGVISP